MRLRGAIASDIPGLVTLWSEFMDYHAGFAGSPTRRDDAETRWATYNASIISDESFGVYVAESECKLVGYVVATVGAYAPIYVEEEFGFIQEIVVNAAYRRNGIGRQLVAAVAAWLGTRGVRRIELKVDAVNDASKRFWSRLGYGPNTETLLKVLSPFTETDTSDNFDK